MDIRRTLMSLNTKQKLAVVAVIGGLVTLPVVYAMSGSEQEILNNKNHYGNGSAVIISGNKVTTGNDRNFNQVQTMSNAPNYGGQGPAARNGLTARDVPTNEYQANNSASQFTANDGGSSNYNQSASCHYYSEAGRLGIYHFSFPEASSADLVTINGYKVNGMAADKLRQMIADARSQGVTLTIGSAFRSVDYQRGIVQRKKAAGQSAKQIYFVSSHPGFSEHHTGLAIDFTPINHGFAKTAGYGWLRNNAYKYGFEQTFTSEYSQATGVSQESWHWKFTGSPQAKAMLANSQCYKIPKSQWHAS